MPSTENEAFEAMLAHHAALVDGVERRAAAVEGSGTADNYTLATAELVAYMATEVLPHAAAEEQTIYRTAADEEALSEVVAAMVNEHRQLESLVNRLAAAADRADAAAEVDAIRTLFAAHVVKENELILPLLASDEAVDLGELLGEMRRLMETAKDQATSSEGSELWRLRTGRAAPPRP